MTIGARIKKARLDKGLTQERLAQKTNLSRSAISSFERLKDRVPRELDIIASALNVSALWLRHGDSIEIEKETISLKIPNYVKIPYISFDTLMKASTINELNKFYQEPLKYMDIISSSDNKDSNSLFCIQIPYIDALVDSSKLGDSLLENSILIFDASAIPNHLDFVLLNISNEIIIRQYLKEGQSIYYKAINPSYPLLKNNSETSILAVLKESQLIKKFENKLIS